MHEVECGCVAVAIARAQIDAVQSLLFGGAAQRERGKTKRTDVCACVCERLILCCKYSSKVIETCYKLGATK